MQGQGVRTRVKICGLTTKPTLQACVDAGADAVGLVFYAPSPRAVSVAQARALVQGLPPYVQVVGLFVDASADEVAATVAAVGLDVIQLHGDETPEQAAHIGQVSQRRWYKALAVRPDQDLRAQILAHQQAGASAVLLDAWHADLKGGTGQTFDWSCWPQELSVPLILAGGLNPDNIATAIATVRPYAVDVSGGVEQSRGVKSPQRIRDFLAGVQQANGQFD